MPKPTTLKIDCSKILKQHLYKGKQRQDGSQPLYLNVVAWKNKDGPDQYGNTHYLVQEISREAREAGERGLIIGNLTMPEDDLPVARTRTAAPARGHSSAELEDSSDVPF